MRRSLKIAGLVLGLAVLFGLAVSWLAPPSTFPPAEPEDPELQRLEGHESGFYPYLSAERSFQNRSPVNIVVKGNLSEVVTALQERSEQRWNDTTSPVGEDANVTGEEARGINVTGTDIRWGQTSGTDRYAYVHDGGEGRWIDEDAQLHDGDYFGYRYHIRLYESPSEDEPWVIMQVHSEHLDWFTLRHSVDGVQEAQHRLESDLMDEPYVERVWREHLDNDGSSDSDGWATVIELAIALPVGLAMVQTRQGQQASPWHAARGFAKRARERLTMHHAVLAASIVTIVLGVRWAGIMLERHVEALSAYAIGGILYPVLAFGLPLAAYLAAHAMERRMDAGLTAAGALGAAFILDYVYLGVDVLAIDILVHRVALVVALGLIAAGSARRAARLNRFNATLGAGLTIWLGLLIATLLGWI